MDMLSSIYPSYQIGSDGFSWWIGQIDSVREDDRKGSGRFRVRIVGLHPESCDIVDKKDLPWAITMMPVTNPHIAGGHASVSDQLEEGVWVVGFFLDNEKQQPVIMGSIGRVAGSSSEETPSDRDPNECHSFKTFLSPNTVAADQTAEENPAPVTVQAAGHAPDGAPRKDDDDKPLGSNVTNLINARYSQNTETNPAGINWCVEIADKCGKENDLSGSLTRIIAEMLYEVQRNDGQLGTYLVGELNGELYDIIGVGRKYVDKSIRVVRKFVAAVKGFVLDKMKAGIKDLVNFLLGANPNGNSLSSITKWFNDLLEQVGCEMADLGDRIAAFLEDLIFGYLFEVYKAAACVIDTFIEGLISKIVSLIEDLLSAVLGPLQDILGAVASAINIVSEALNYVLNLLGISCSGPKKSCTTTKTYCTNCSSDKKTDNKDFLDDLLAGIDDLFPATGEDWSQYVCEEGQEGTTITDTNVTFIGGVQTPETVPVIEYFINNVTVTEGEEAVFTVTRTGFTEVASSVSYITKDGTATGGSDYESLNGFVGFVEGEDSKTITIKTFLDDDDSEPAEDFFVVLSPETPETVTSVATANVGKCTISKSPTNGGPVQPPTDADDPTTTPPVVVTPTFPPNTATPTDPGISDPPNTIPDDEKEEDTVTQTFSVKSDKASVKEGEFITYTITTTNVADNLKFSYKLFGTGITSEDIVSKSLSGEFVIVNSTAQVVVGIAPDSLVEGTETLVFGIPGTGAQTSVLIIEDTEGSGDVVENFDTSSNITASASPKPKTPTFGEVITDGNGSIVEIQIGDPGDIYDEAPVVIVTGEGYGAAALPLLDDNGRLSEIRVTSPGYGYKINTPTTAKKECIIDSFTLLSVGKNYKTAPTVYVDGDSSVAEAVINDRGQVISVRIKNRELTFESYPKVLILGGGGYGARAIPSFACLDPIARVEVGSAKVGTGSYVDCP